MNQDIFEGDWKKLKGDVRKRWGKLTDDHLAQVNGSREKLVGQIQKNYGIVREEAEKQVKEWEGARKKSAEAA